jgi:4a-hydroxytetrahydrobiopterin dehydratase
LILWVDRFFVSTGEAASIKGRRLFESQNLKCETEMNLLTHERCVACRRDSPLVTEAEVLELKPQIPDWTLLDDGGVNKLERVFRFRNFAEALRFTNEVGALAEEEGHHPAVLTEWGRVTVKLWTHKIRGLHRNDFIIAAKVDSLPSAGSTG